MLLMSLLQPAKGEDIDFSKMYNLPYQFIQKYIILKVERGVIMIIYSNIQHWKQNIHLNI